MYLTCVADVIYPRLFPMNNLDTTLPPRPRSPPFPSARVYTLPRFLLIISLLSHDVTYWPVNFVIGETGVPRKY